MTPGHGLRPRPDTDPAPFSDTHTDTHTDARTDADTRTAADAPARATLAKAASENFPVAPAFLPRAWREGLMAVYGFARLVDDIGDGDLAPGGGDAVLLGLEPAAGDDRLAMLDALEADLRRVFAATAGPPRHPLLLALAPVVRAHGLTPEPFLGLIEANRQDQRVARYATYGELLDYCELSANPVGRLVLSLTGTSSPERIRRSDAICTALQIVEHLQDVAEDLDRDRIYLPAEDMRRFHVAEHDLRAPSAGASVRALVAFEAERARALLDEGTPLVAGVHGRLRLLLAGFVGGGRAALKAVSAAGFDVLPGPPKSSRSGLLREVAAVLRTAPRKG
ncbi:squalene synthase HpnC [Streptomyces sp. RerS4]|uniref:squalene synthase HpnC n=1 Tax=Streptomyces sp. RerS4 TaxID=2942449 RepID=UPI00201C5294|nr:squalene synthase HpnC [Streptomyces sp. RerS4]UQX03945.1 squalene synthase HpnC [Streptomyces sp. RerS4]